MLERLNHLIVIMAVVAYLVMVTRQLELRWPIDPSLSRSDVIADWMVTAANVALARMVGPVAGVCSAVIVGAAGGGLIHLRTDGLWYGVSLIGVIVVSDLYFYCYHRLAHAVPFLWAMHSLHHSAESLTFITGARHYWLESALSGAFLPIVPILFTIPPDMASVVGFINFLPNVCVHMNCRFRLGPAITWLNSPQWHRIHHSVQPEHFDKNFAALLPLWDILFGTAWIPRPDEYPATGLVPGEKVGLFQGVVWPFRHYLRRLPVYKDRRV